jgi:hypothetical protein
MMAEYGRPQMQNDNTDGSNTSSALPEQTPSPTSTAAQGLLHFRHPSNASQDLQDFQNGASHVRLSLTPPQSSHSDSSYLPFITSPISTSNSNPQTVPIHIRDLLQADDQADDTFDPILSNVPLKLYGERMQLPFKVPHEALLFQHYMEHLAPLVSKSQINIRLDLTFLRSHSLISLISRGTLGWTFLNGQ